MRKVALESKGAFVSRRAGTSVRTDAIRNSPARFLTRIVCLSRAVEPDISEVDHIGARVQVRPDQEVHRNFQAHRLGPVHINPQRFLVTTGRDPWRNPDHELEEAARFDRAQM